MTILKLKSGYDFETNNFKGVLFCQKKKKKKKKNVAGVTVLILYMLSDAALYLNQVGKYP